MHHRLPVAAALAPAAILTAALASQYVGGLAPCELCIWQRWPHLAAAVLGVAYLLAGRKALGWLAAAALVAGSAVAVYHVGVEQGVWEGPQTCSGGALSELAGGSLLDFSQPVNVVRCDEVAWSWLSLSMAAWNALLSLMVAAMWAMTLIDRPSQTSS